MLSRYINPMLLLFCTTNTYGIDFEKIEKFKGTAKSVSSVDNSGVVQASADLQSQFIEEDQEARSRRSTSTATVGNPSCHSIKNEALQAYCLKGDSVCYKFGERLYREKYSIPIWVEEFCSTGYHSHIKNKALEIYMDIGATYQFKDTKINAAAIKYSRNQSQRKKWVIFFANGVLLE